MKKIIYIILFSLIMISILVVSYHILDIEGWKGSMIFLIGWYGSMVLDRLIK